MSMPNQQAAESLHEIEHTVRRSAAAYGYQKASPHLIQWGVVWMAGYSLTYVRPQWSAVWPVLVLLGIAGDFGIARYTRSKGSLTSDWRFASTALALFLFFVALFAIMPPRSGAQAGAFFPIFVGLCYAIVGIWKRAARMVLVGLAVGVLTVGGYFWLPQYFLPWMAVVGGGALILGGLWLRRV
jgi:hypothetical protein